MRTIRFLMLFFLYLLLFSPILKAEDGFNDDPADLQLDEALKLDLVVDDQAYPSKTFTMKLTIDSLIDSGKTTIDWYYDDKIVKRAGPEQDVIQVSKDGQVVVYKEFTPNMKYTLLENYDFAISVRVVSAAYEKNYVSTDRVELSLNRDFEIDPILDSYTTHKNIYNILTTALYCLVGALVLTLLTLGIRRFISYLNSDDS